MDRKFLRPGWIVGHLLVVLAVLVCLRLGRWQWHRMHEGGTIQNFGYAVLWPVFGVAFVYMWFRFLQLEKLKDAEEDAELTALAAGERSDATGTGRRLEDSRPETALPSDAVPINAVPGDAVPINAVPGDAVPINVVPSDAVPINAVPSDAVPGDPVPSDGEFVVAGTEKPLRPAVTGERDRMPGENRPVTPEPGAGAPASASAAAPVTTAAKRSRHQPSTGVTVSIATVGDENDDPELAAYNRALAALAEKDHRRAR